VDHTHTLKPGQIFLQYSSEGNSEVQVIEGPVAVYRNPCYHPGDLRVLEAIDHPELRRRYMNVVVFPSMMRKSPRGDLEDLQQRPHSDGTQFRLHNPDLRFLQSASEMAGGDLDGDQYMVIWAQRLVPKKNADAALYSEFKPRKACDVSMCKKLVSPLPQEAMTQMIHFFVYYAARLDNIGIINSKHAKYCETVGINHPDSLKLAVLVSKAMDAAKTGEDLTPDERALMNQEPPAVNSNKKSVLSLFRYYSVSPRSANN
jgi:RNA-dependent RNA polymerase